MNMQLNNNNAGRYLPFFLILVLLVSACTGGDVEPAAEADEAITNDNAALTAVDETEEPASVVAPEVDSSGPASLPVAEEAGSDTPETASDGEAVSPVTVNLADITPEAGGSNENVVQPAPGVPDLGVKMANIALQELANRLNIDVGEIDISLIEEREWSDGSLGCPAEGYMYTQALVPGYYILLLAGDEEYAYHTDAGNQVILCVDGAPAP